MSARISRACHALALLLVPSLLGGCAGDGAARRMADTGAALVDAFGRETQHYAEAEGRLDQAIAASLARRRRDAAVLANQSKLQRAAWIGGNAKAALSLYDALAAPSADALLTGSLDLQTLRPVSVAAPGKIDSKPFDDTVAGLKKLAEKPNLLERGSFLFKEGKAVYDGYTESMKDAAEKAKQAEAKTPAVH